LEFLRVVEVFPPIVRKSQKGNLILEAETSSFVEGVGRIRRLADIVLVARLKNPELATMPPATAASLLVRKVGVDAAPVLVARDSNRQEIASMVLGAYSLGVRTLMLAWGDRQPGEGPRSAHGLTSLSQVIAHARSVSRTARIRGRFLAPIDLARLSGRKGVHLAKSRLNAGAALLLAQPPTTDSDRALDAHLALLDASGLRDSVLLSVFPFRDRDDVIRCEQNFGWRLPPSLKRRAATKDFAPIDEARVLVRRLRKEGLPGVYLSTRGSPDIAEKILGCLGDP
jgi:5,10-methylenetetrahydrofolate reductase